MRTDFLASMAQSSHQRAQLAEAACGREALLHTIAQRGAPPRLRLSSQGFDLIAEVKLRSPAAGLLRDGASEDIAARAQLYAQAGAAAISVLTEPSRFDGELAHLRQSVAVLDGVPAMRKDFLVNDYQLLEARAAGAGGALLIVRMLSPATLKEMIRVALEQALFVLLEVFDEADIDIVTNMLRSFQRDLWWADGMPRLLVGVNCRDLVTLQVVPERLFALAARLPSEIPKVAESGLETAQDAARLAAAGYDLALVGSALMRTHSPAVLAHDMLQAAREARGSVR